MRPGEGKNCDGADDGDGAENMARSLYRGLAELGSKGKHSLGSRGLECGRPDRAGQEVPGRTWKCCDD